MLNQIDNPSAIPAAMGMALVTTLYGLILSALIFKPISGKIRDINNIDTNIRNIIIEGIRSIQKGENSQITKEKLAGYVKEGSRK
jgi:chemotaxis protein MotA